VNINPLDLERDPLEDPLFDELLDPVDESVGKSKEDPAAPGAEDGGPEEPDSKTSP
jgi:hypothetical protein